MKPYTSEYTERSYSQWLLIRALAFGERDWMTICSVLFLISSTREFLTLPGATGFVLGVMFLGPVFGMLIYFTSHMIYRHKKSKNKPPATAGQMKGITWMANALCFPIILATSWLMFDLYYESYDSILAIFKAP